MDQYYSQAALRIWKCSHGGETWVPTFFVFLSLDTFILYKEADCRPNRFLYLFQFVLQLGTKLQLLAGMNTFRIENRDQS